MISLDVRGTARARWIFRHSRAALLATALASLCCGLLASPADEVEPRFILQRLGKADPLLGRFSDRSLSLAMEMDRDGARLLRYTLKDHPFDGPLTLTAPRGAAEGRPLQVEVVLLGQNGRRLTRRFDLGPLCLLHSPAAPPHVQGDTILLHRDTFVIELPELTGFDRLETAIYHEAAGGLTRKVLATERLDAPRFAPSGGGHRYRDLLFAVGGGLDASLPSDSGVTWPEDVGDPQIYRVVGNASEAVRRLNVIVIPDGYTYAEKATLDFQFDLLTNTSNGLDVITPFGEHGIFINYVLVYAYSNEDGADECDCGVVRDTAMGTFFRQDVGICRDMENRCLYYAANGEEEGQGRCDVDRSVNIVTAEMRAPVYDRSQGDTTLIMVNTGRYGGCAGTRAVIRRGDGGMAAHEMGHSWAGLADEYAGDPTCGHQASEINTSKNHFFGAWPEWVNDIGDPVEGAQYKDYCIYRPQFSCGMKMGGDFCPVCRQRFTLTFLESPRIYPTTPIESFSPVSATITTQTGVWNPFTVSTRLPGGDAVTNELTWEVQGTGYPDPALLASGVTAYSRPFETPGDYLLTFRAVADANFIKPVKYGPNVDTVSWNVHVDPGPPPSEVSPPGSSEPLQVLDYFNLTWEPASASRSAVFNLYHGEITDLSSGNYGSCTKSGLLNNSSIDYHVPLQGHVFFFLVSGKTGAEEGPLGNDSQGNPRVPLQPCY